MSAPKTARPTERLMCELKREKASVRVTEVTLPSGGRRVVFCHWYKDGAGKLVALNALSFDPDEAERLRLALGSLRKPRATSPEAARTPEGPAPAIPLETNRPGGVT